MNFTITFSGLPGASISGGKAIKSAVVEQLAVHREVQEVRLRYS